MARICHHGYIVDINENIVYTGVCFGEIKVDISNRMNSDC